MIDDEIDDHVDVFDRWSNAIVSLINSGQRDEAVTTYHLATKSIDCSELNMYLYDHLTADEVDFLQYEALRVSLTAHGLVEIAPYEWDYPDGSDSDPEVN